MKKLIFSIIISTFLFGGTVFAKEAEFPEPGFTPDSPFYFLETIAEEIGTFFTLGDLKKAERYATLAAERVAEAKAVVDRGKPELVEKILARYEVQLGKSIIRAGRTQAKGQSVKDVMEIVAEGTGKQLMVIERILDKVSGEVEMATSKAREASITGRENSIIALAKEDPETAATITLKSAESRLNRAKGKAEEGDIDEVEKAIKDFKAHHELGGEISKIAEELGKDIIVIEQLVEKTTSLHLEILAQVYEEVPEKTKSIIEEAIKVSVKGYEQALEALKEKGVSEEAPEEAPIPIPKKIPAEVQKRIREKVREEIEIEKLEEEQPAEVQEEVKETEIPEPEREIGKIACSRTFSPQFGAKSYYRGSLFDAHFHIPISEKFAGAIGERHGEESRDPILGKDVALDDILCFFDKEKTRGAFGFYMVDPTSPEDTLEVAKDIKEQSSDSVALFLMPVALDIEKLEILHESNPGLFKGYGELSFYDVDLKPLTPGDQKLLDVYDVAEKYGLIVMMHPDIGQKSDVERALKTNPGVDFLLHGFESEDYVTDLMDRYPNVYFSIDSAVLYPMMGLFVSGSQEVFVSRFKQDFNSILSTKVGKWKSRIEKHPGRFMWGTDRGVIWHYSEEISILFEEFARAFIARLDPAVQENYAYKNAEELLQK